MEKPNKQFKGLLWIVSLVGVAALLIAGALFYFYEPVEEFIDLPEVVELEDKFRNEYCETYPSNCKGYGTN